MARRRWGLMVVRRSLAWSEDSLRGSRPKTSENTRLTLPRGEAPSATLLGVLAAVVVAGLFFYPTTAYPIQNMALCGMLACLGVGLAVGCRAIGAGGAWLDALGRLPILAGLGLALWAAARWSFILVSASGREAVLGLGWMGVALGTGVGLAVYERTRLVKNGSIFVALRRTLALAAIVFGLDALHQYFISFPRTLAFMEAELGGMPPSDLMTQSLLHRLGEGRVGGGLGDPNLFAAQLSALAVFAVACLQRGEKLVWRGVGALGLALAVVGVYLTQSTGGVLTLLLALALGLLGLVSAGRWIGGPRPGAARALTLFSMTVLAGLLWMIARSASAEGGEAAQSWIGRLTNLSTVRERLFYWKIALDIWAEDPIVGAGPGGFSLLYMTHKPAIARESIHAHSWLFQSLCELGLIGLGLGLLFWGAILALLWKVWRWRVSTGEKRRSERPSEAYWLLACVVVLGFNGLMQFTLQWPVFLIFTGLVAGAAVGYPASERPTTGGTGKGPLIRGMAPLMAGSLLVLALAMMPRYHLAAHHKNRAADLMQEGRYTDAEAAYGRAVGWLPDDGGLLVAHARAVALAGKPSHEWPMLLKAGNLNPYSASIRAAQARWLWSRGRQAEAIVRMSEAIERYPTDAGHRLERARMLAEAGKIDNARADLEFIEREQAPVWEFQFSLYQRLRAAVGMEPVDDDQ